VRQGLARGHRISAFVRDAAALNDIAHERVNVVRGNVLASEVVDAAVRGHDGVLCTLGSRSIIRRDTLCSEATKYIVAGMTRHGVRRLVVCTSSGVGDSRSNIPWIGRWLVDWVVADKEAQERVVRESATEWVLVRPAGLRDGPPRGEIAVGLPGPLPTRSISRAGVAAFMLDQLTSNEYLFRAPAISAL
jgi:uncharacterized protein YbjT (DUF2867 family)